MPMRPHWLRAMGVRRGRLPTLVSYIKPDNARSVALAERLGAAVRHERRRTKRV